MKFSLTISSDDPSELARFLASLGGSTAMTVTAAPVAPVAAVADDDDESKDTPTAPGALDKDGLPWDDRIHSTPATQTTKGVWRKKRGVSDALVNQVEAELRLRAGHVSPQPAPVPTAAPVATPPVMMQPPAQPAPVPQPMPQMQPAPMPVPVMMQPPAQPAPVPQPMPVQQMQPAPVPQQPAQLDFAGFMQHIQAMLPRQIIDAPYLASVAQRIGAAFNTQVNAITDIAGNQQMIDYAVQIMASEGRWQ